MVSAREAITQECDDECQEEPQLWEIVEDIIKLVGEGKDYWAGVALCNLRERLKNGK